MTSKYIKPNSRMYTRMRSRRKYKEDKKETFLLFYDFSSLIDIDFRTSFNEHLSDYENYEEKREHVLKCTRPETWSDFYPPVVQHFMKTFADDYMFQRFMLYLNDRELEVYLITGTEFTEEEKEGILKCFEKCDMFSSHFDFVFGDRDMFKRVKGILNFSSREQLIGDIKDILCKNSSDGDYFFSSIQEPPYLVISGNDYSEVFPRHSMIPEEEGVIPNMNYMRACYLLYKFDGEYGYTHGYEHNNPRFCGDRIIFLDIDGVLNRDGDDENGQHEYFNEGMVKELSRLISMTNAKVILTSSWRGAFKNYIFWGSEDENEKLVQFMEILKRENIRIYGMTPDGGMRGGITRPLEIRTWLSWYPEIESFVILEDDTFWNWGYLRHNVVTTITQIPEEELFELKKKYPYPNTTRDGLTRELADKAAVILLRKNDACIMREY